MRTVAKQWCSGLVDARLVLSGNRSSLAHVPAEEEDQDEVGERGEWGRQELRMQVEALGRSSSSEHQREWFAWLLSRCGLAKALSEGRRVHQFIAKLERFSGDGFLSNHLIKMYDRCGSAADAARVFETAKGRNRYTWNNLLSAYAQNGQVLAAKAVFDSMPCRNVVSWNSIVSAYGRSGELQRSAELFLSMPETDVIAWNGIIAAFAQNGESEEALRWFRRMELEAVRPNHVTFLGILEACEGQASLSTGRAVHARIRGTGLERHVKVATSIVTMYGKCRNLSEARLAFESMHFRNRISWNAIIAAFAHNGETKAAMELFRDMLKSGLSPNHRTLLGVVEACSHRSTAEERDEVAAFIDSGPTLRNDVKLGTALINMYGKCGNVVKASKVFERLPRTTDVMVWTSMITAYARCGLGDESISLLPWMDVEGVRPDKVTFISLLDACATVTDLRLGRSLHATLVEQGMDPNQYGDVTLSTSLLYMYGRCGSLPSARLTFNSMSYKNRVTWNAMITVYAQAGHASEASHLFREMELDGESPNDCTCTSLLAACSHAGMTEEGHHCFITMVENYGMELSLDHYACMVDLLARVGKVAQAEELAECMPFEPDIVTWTSLLAACKTHKNVDVGLRVSRRVFEMKPGAGCSYTMISDVIACSGRDKGLETSPSPLSAPPI